MLPGVSPKAVGISRNCLLYTSCKQGISLPQFWECFRERTENWWETFAEMEAELRQMMDEDKDHTRGAELVAQICLLYTSCIAATVAYILEWFGIPIDTEEAIRERDWCCLLYTSRCV